MSNFLKTRLLKPSVLIGGCIVLSKVLAGGAETPMGLPTPGVSLYGLAGNGWLGAGDVLAPVFGQENGFAYVDPQFYYHSNNGYTGSLGAGYRQLTNNTGILGAYVFGDYIRSTNDHSFWFVSPGIERLGQILDFSANAYIPVSSQRINTGTEFADQVGDFSQIVFTGHDQFDGLVNTFTSVGYGGDAQIGVHLPFFRNSEVFVGGYYFAPKDTDSVGGGAVRLQVPVNRYLSVIASEAYDSEYHNTVKAGLTLWFGGRSTGYGFTGNLAERLVDPIQRDLVLVAGGSATGVPAVSDYENTGQIGLELSNISFFVPDAGAPSDTSAAVQGNGTYENPYVGMSQDNVNNANTQNNRNFYIDSGTYHPTYDGMNDYIVLNNDQLYGRQDNFKQAAQGPLRPLMLFTDGGFEIPATDVNDSINGLQLTGMNASDNAGIWIDHENSPLNQTVLVSNTSLQAFGDGIDILNSNSPGALAVTVNNTWIGQNNGQGELFALYGVTGGIGAFNDVGSSPFLLTVTHTTITDNSKAFANDTLEAIGGLAVENLGNMSLGVYSSNFSGNSFSFDGVNANAAGGMAIVQHSPEDSSQSTMNVDVRNSNLSNNSVSLNNSSTVLTTGGMAINQNNTSGVTVGASTMSVNVSGSNLSDNSISVNGSEASVAGGLAILQFSVTDPATTVGASTMNVNVSHSNLSGNSISLDNGSSSIASGGLAISQNNQDSETTMSVNVRGSSLSDNSVALDDSSPQAVGGLAIQQFTSAPANSMPTSTMNVNVSGSKVLGNSVYLDSSGAQAAGGIAVYQIAASSGAENTMCLDVRNSQLSDNSVYLDNGGNTQAAGGMAIYQSSFISSQNTMTVNISGSSLSGNSISLDNGGNAQAAGGMAISQNGFNSSQNAMTVNIRGSSLSNNSVSVDNGVLGSSVSTAGGLAIIQTDFNSVNTMTVNVKGSSLSGNSVSMDNGAFAVSAGGMAIFQAGFGSSSQNTMTVNVSGSSLSDNSVSLDGAFINTAGGMAIYQSGSNSSQNMMTINVGSSSISGNSVSMDNGASANAAGGTAISQNASNNATNTMNVDILGSSLSGNSVLDNGSTVDAAGGIAIFQRSFNPTAQSITMDISGSSVSGNSVSLDNGASANAAGGIAISQGGFASNGSSFNATISGSKVSNNAVSNNGGTVNATGGVAVFNSFSNNSADIDITKSIITFNSGSGIAVDGPNIQVSVDRSIIAWNTLYGLSAINNGEIDVGSQMLFFNGLVQVSGGTVTFPAPVGSLPDNTTTQVVCVLGSCNTVP